MNKLRDLVGGVKQRGDVVIVHNQSGCIIKRYKTLDLGMEYFRMSNNDFLEKYGFRFQPKGYWFDRCKREVGDEIYFSKKFVTKLYD